MNKNNLNLARKLRPKIFEEIIGQDLSVSMLKNSLYVKKLFPVYLFSGQRGCGKTSTARVFGCAVNCKKLPDFQTDAKNNPVPCLKCESCLSMLASNHPDFIEMDAASHTGVDSVRQIIESCTYMPLAGAKKIYLIDEAHMLSKAAFNAFLKILEEPPSSTIFILATTEIQKIPETVRSRCFQVLFNPVQNDILFGHLQKICVSETIDAQDDALKLLVQENDGSVRDALNTLEQVRFSGQKITKELVLTSLGKLSETKLFTLVNAIVDQKPKALLEHLHEIKFENLAAQNLWSTIVQVLRNVLWVKYGVTNKNYDFDEGNLGYIAKKCTVNRIHALLQILWSQESLFLQTPQKHVFLETVLLQMCHQVNIEDLKTLIQECKNMPAATPITPTQQVTQQSRTASQIASRTAAQTAPQPSQGPWTSFVSDLEKEVSDPLLLSFFKQARFLGTENNKSKVKLQLANNNSFLRDKVRDTEELWKPVLKKYFTTFDSFEFTAPAASNTTSQPPQNYQPRPKSFSPGGSPFKFVDISDQEKWPKANLLTKHFSGKIEKE